MMCVLFSDRERVVTFVRITFKVDNNKQANIDAPEEKCFRPEVAFFGKALKVLVFASSLLLQYYLKSTPI